MAYNKNPVKKYWLKCTLGSIEYEYTVLAIDSDWALTMISKDTDWDSITLRKLTGIIAMADFGCRNISNESEEIFLNYHCIPV